MSERQRGTHFVPPLGLDDTILVRHDARRTEGGKDGLQRQHRGVVLLREVAEGKLLAALLDEFQQLCRALVVGEVAPDRLDAGAQIVGVRPAAEHMQVVVALEGHKVAAGEGFMYSRSQHTEVGGDGHGLLVGGVDAVAHTGDVVAGGKSFDPEDTDVLFPARRQGCHAASVRDNAVCVQKFQCLLCTVHRQRIFFQEGGKALHMVAMLMGDKNAVAVGDVQLQLLEGCAGGADAFAHIHDEIPLPTAHDAAVAGGTGIKRDKFRHDKPQQIKPLRLLRSHKNAGT